MMRDKNIPYTVYYRNHLGYDSVCSRSGITAARGNIGGVGIVSQEKKEGWIVESTRFHGPDVVSWKLVVSNQHTPLIGE